MIKKTIRDIKIKKRKTSTDITIPTSSTAPSTRTLESKKSKATSVEPKKPSVTSKKSAYTHSYQEHQQSRSYLWFWIVLVIIIGGAVAWTILGTARVEITPEYAKVNDTVTIRAYKDASLSEDGLEYKIIALSNEISSTIPAGEAEYVESRAQGTVVIYNKESSPQRLIEETRFETPEGLIFKLAKGGAITIPAASGSTPGSVEATVYADELGEKYNIDLTDFVIPGWREAGSTKFNTQYARSKTPMSGGFVGTKRIVSDSQQSKTQEELQTTLRNRLTEEAPAQIPPNFVFFNEISHTSFETLPVVNSETKDEVVLKEKGTLYGLLFDRNDLSKLLAKEMIPEYDGESILVTNFNELIISDVTPNILSESDTEVSFTIKGDVTFEWQIDTETVHDKLIGIAKKNFESTMRAFTGVHNAELVLYPVWLPKIPQKIHLEVMKSVK